jgi:hypothetical protein
MPTETPQVNESQARAVEDLEHISSLLRFGPFRAYYQRRLTEKIAAMEEGILEDESLTDQELRIRLRLRKVLKELQEMPEADAAACRKLLSS